MLSSVCSLGFGEAGVRLVCGRVKGLDAAAVDINHGTTTIMV